ncbi:MAG TPA: DMT family transporter [Candidatus Saccharimonadales bacterium]|nr:DMT family transporter [Candidatus Saccharimonadales bacterium]
MTWQLLISINLFLVVATFLFRRRLATTFIAYNKLLNGFFFVFVLYPFGLIAASLVAPDLNIGWSNFLLLFFGEAIFPIINLLAFRASKSVDAGAYSLLNNLTPVITVLTAWILLQEGLNDQQLVGAIIILLSACLIALPGFNRRSISSYGLFVALASVILLGLAITYERFMLTRIDIGAYWVYGWGFQALWMALITGRQWKKLRVVFKPKIFGPLMGYSVSHSLSGLTFVGALKLSVNVSLVTTFRSFSAVMVVIAAYIFLRERDYLWLKIGCAILGAVGLIILNLG